MLEKETAPGSGIWEAYTGTHVTLDGPGRSLTIETAIDDYALDNLIYSMRIGVASVPFIEDPLTPMYWDLTV